MATPPGPARARPLRRVMILAGEASGDAHGARVAAEVRRRWPGVEMTGLGGERLEAAGVRLLRRLDELAVMGFAEVAAKLRFFRRLEREVQRLLAGGRFDVVIPVDYPGFNLRVASAAGRLGVPVLYYIGPQVWAWKAGRARRLAEAANRIALVLPFEPPLYERHGGRAVFVGHPLLDDQARGDPDGLARTLGLDARRPVLALFPGSRRQELVRHAGPFVGAAKLLQERVAGLQVVVAKAPSLGDDLYRRFPFARTEEGASLRALATAGLVKSGTSTLEAALAGMPFAVAYVTHPATFAVARRLVRVPHVALANLVAGRRVVPEFVQRQARPGALAAALAPLLDRKAPERRAMLEGLEAVRAGLGAPGASVRVADLAEEVAGERAPGVRA